MSGSEYVLKVILSYYHSNIVSVKLNETETRSDSDIKQFVPPGGAWHSSGVPAPHPTCPTCPAWLSLWDTPPSLLLKPRPLQHSYLAPLRVSCSNKPAVFSLRRVLKASMWHLGLLPGFRGQAGSAHILPSFHPPSCLQAAGDRNLRGRGGSEWTQHGVRGSLQLCL